MLNRDLRPAVEYICVSPRHGLVSNLFISGIPDALDPHRQFNAPDCAVFSWNDLVLFMPRDDIKVVIGFALSQNGILQNHLGDRFDSRQDITAVSMNETDQGMNLIVFNARGLVMGDHQMGSSKTHISSESFASSIYSRVG
jgi:hypothetical protein